VKELEKDEYKGEDSLVLPPEVIVCHTLQRSVYASPETLRRPLPLIIWFTFRQLGTRMPNKPERRHL